MNHALQPAEEAPSTMRTMRVSGWCVVHASVALAITFLFATTCMSTIAQEQPAPQEQSAAAPAPTHEVLPCQSRRAAYVLAWDAVGGAGNALPEPALAGAYAAMGNSSQFPVRKLDLPPDDLAPCSPFLPMLGNLGFIAKLPMVNWYARFLNGPQVKPMTPKEKAWLAVRNVIDPFNAITILGSSAVAVAADSHSAYGPGMRGFGRYVGVSYTQDMTGEFFGTFLIPSIAHQDPHYHRMPHASIKHRILHAASQVVWTQGDNGRGMLNYANLAGFAIDDEIGNLYIPDRRTNAEATATRYGIGFATAPIDNFITEFLPDVARRIHVRVVLIQQIIDQVALKDGSGFQ